MRHDLLHRVIDERNDISRAFFGREAERLARVCQAMAGRFVRGGRLIAFGRGAAATDAQHVAVEFVHPVLVGKRALPALDLSVSFGDWLPAILRPADIVMGFGPPAGDPEVDRTLRDASARGALTLALPGTAGDYAVAAPSADPFVHQEMIEVLYHTLWETVHVFFEHQSLDQDAGPAAFLYPFLGDREADIAGIVRDAAASIRSKAACTDRLRTEAISEQGDAILGAVEAIAGRVERGGTIVCFGNGGSATDATDLALDCVLSPKGHRRVPALSLSTDAATLTAIANDVGSEAVFSRQLIACARAEDVAVAISTSGGSANIIAALTEARARGLLTVALLGYDGGEVLRRDLADHALIVRSDQIPRVQEVQASIYHVMLDRLDAG